MLLGKPRVLILDEPTASMDAAAEAQVVTMLNAAAESGATLLVATHKSALLPIVSRLLVIQGGRVVIDGPRDLVLAKLSAAQPASAAAPQRAALATVSG
jgi:ATP-binding cassette subfamily C protein LapB